MNTLEYLDAVKAKKGLKSDYQLAQALETSTAAIGQYRNRKRVMDDYTAARVAELAEVDPLEVIAQANAEREKDEKKRAYWARVATLAKRGGMRMALAVLSFVTLLLTQPGNAYADQGFNAPETSQSTNYGAQSTRAPIAG